MSSEVQAAIIAGLVALIVSVLSSIFTYFSIRQARYESKRLGITQQRMNWIYDIRKLFAEVISFELADVHRKEVGYDSINKTIQLLTLYLNFDGKIDKEILDSLELMHSVAFTLAFYDEEIRPDFKDLNGTFNLEKKAIQKYAHIYLKSEWNRVKFESDPKNDSKKYPEKLALKELELKYKDATKHIESRPKREAEDIYSRLPDEYKLSQD